MKIRKSPAPLPNQDEIIIPWLIHIEGDEYSLEEAHAIRESVYDVLRTHIPLKDVIDAVEAYQPRSAVTWTDEGGQSIDLSHVGEGQSVYAAVQRKKLAPAELVQELVRFTAKAKEPPKSGPPATAGELLAHTLRTRLTILRQAEQALRKGASSKTPVRDRELLPQSVIAEVANDLLQDCETWGYPPGSELTALIRELLRVDGTRKGSDREYKAKHEAAWILAQADVGVRKLASMVGVSPSTVSSWRNDPEFAALDVEGGAILEHPAAADQRS